MFRLNVLYLACMKRSPDFWINDMTIREKIKDLYVLHGNTEFYSFTCWSWSGSRFCLLQERLDPHLKPIGPIMFLGCIINHFNVNIMRGGGGTECLVPHSFCIHYCVCYRKPLSWGRFIDYRNEVGASYTPVRSTRLFTLLVVIDGEEDVLLWWEIQRFQELS